MLSRLATAAPDASNVLVAAHNTIIVMMIADMKADGACALAHMTSVDALRLA